MRYKKQVENKTIAKERIKILQEMIKTNPSYAQRYKELIDKIAKKYRLESEKKKL